VKGVYHNHRKFTLAKGTIYMREVPRHVRDLFHSACVKRGRSMKSVLVQFMKEFATDTEGPDEVRKGKKAEDVGHEDEIKRKIKRSVNKVTKL
jgi:hypothetical protein